MSYPAPTMVASGTTWTQLLGFGFSGHLENLLSAQVATSNPITAPTVNSTGVSTSGGLMAAGGYYANFTEGNAFGETLPSVESAVFTVAAGNIPLMTLPARQTNNQYANIYVTGAGGNTGTEVRYISGVTSNTVALATAVLTGTGLNPLPTANTTAPSAKTIPFIRAGERNMLEIVYNRARTSMYDFLHGSPVNQVDMLKKFREAHAAIAALDTAMNEMGTLADANPGSIKSVVTGIGGSAAKRSWP